VNLYGKVIEYAYDDGWQYRAEFSPGRIDYAVVGGPFAGRKSWQDAEYAEITEDISMVGWYEDNGAIVAAVLNLDAMTIHGYVTLPKYVVDNPPAIMLDKSTRLPEILAMRDKGQDAPRKVDLKRGKILSVTAARR
jgi:phenolic acid decarboxylase